jgi:hypothetical protein
MTDRQHRQQRLRLVQCECECPIAVLSWDSKTVSSRVLLNGGTLLDVAQLAARKREKERLVQKIKDALAEIEPSGAPGERP